MLRGSGVDWDLRRDGEPICTEMYDGYTWQVIAPTDGRYPQDHPYPPVPPRGGCGRFLASVFRADARSGAVGVLDSAGDGKICRGPGAVDEPIPLKKKLPKGEAYLETEAPKGQMGFMIIKRWLAGAVARGDPQQ